jgi:hypothetical protein
MYNLAKENRELQIRLLGIVESRIPLVRNKDMNAANSSVKSANEIVFVYNNNVRKIDEILRRLQTS